MRTIEGIEPVRPFVKPCGEVSTLRERAAFAGWAVARASPERLMDTMQAIAATLGPVVGGRNGRLVEEVVPRPRDEAHSRSISRTHGIEALPLHVELGHRPRPCRYVLLGCIDPGAGKAGTSLLDWRELAFDEDLLGEMASTPMFVRSGRRSFYTTMLPRCRSWLRFDRGCLEPVTARSAAALQRAAYLIDGAEVAMHRWTCGDVLLFDNWRVLHGREAATVRDGRRLVRMLIDG
jgi:hypothetical protein